MSILRQFRRWLIERYLPAYISAANKEDIAALKAENTALRQRLDKEQAYSAGFEYAMRHRAIVYMEKGG